MPQDSTLTGRVALVTGGGSGLGRAVARRLARRGVTPVAADLNADAAEETARLVGADGGTAHAMPLDVSDPQSVATTVASVFDRFGDAFDCLVNNAGTDQGAGIMDITDEQWQRVIGVNQSGPLFTTRAFLRGLPAGERARPADVINVISISAITVGTEAAAYNASKAALAKLTQVMQREAAEYRWPVRVHGLMPSAMDTPMMEQWGLAPDVMMAPDTVASAIEFMLTLPPDAFVQNLVVTSRREPGWPR